MATELILNYLKKQGFIETKDCSKYPPLGYTFVSDTDFNTGYYWYYDTELFTISIHNFFIKKEYVMDFKFEEFPIPEIISSFVFKAHGEIFAPYYMNISNNMVLTTISRGDSMRWVLHKNFPYFTVGICFKDVLLQEYLEMDDVEIVRAFMYSSPNVTKQLEKLALEILNYKSLSPASHLFFEAKTREWLSIIINEYFEQKNRKKISKEDEVGIDNVERYINDHLETSIPQELLASIALMSKTKLKESFKMKYGMSITEYTQRKRMNKAERLLVNTDLKIEEVAKSVGYNSHSRFSKLFKKYIGNYPNEVRKK